MSFQKEFGQLSTILESAKSILITIHPRPDADALGSAFALRGYLEKAFPETKVTITHLTNQENSLLNFLIAIKF